MTTEEMIEVMKAYTEGKHIEYRRTTHDPWREAIPRWDWNRFEYRVKPEKKEPTYRPYKDVIKEIINMATADNANDYDVETLVKMWKEQNNPSSEHIDFDVQDDGSISIFGLIHDGVDYWSQEWEILAEFKNIDELKAAVGV